MKSTVRFILIDSHSPIKHKHAAFHRSVKLLLLLTNYKNEYDRIISDKNGYNPNLIDRLVKKHIRNVSRSRKTILYSQNHSICEINNGKKRVCSPFVPEVTNQFKDVFNKNNIYIVYSNDFKLKNLLGSIKGRVDSLDKPGIYRITC